MPSNTSRQAKSSPQPDSDYVQRKAAIRQRARDVFLRHGYRKTTIEDIGRACGLGKAALYHYFTSKEAIFAEVVGAEGEQMLARVREAVASSDDPKVQLVAMLKASFEEVNRLAGELVGNKNVSELMTTTPLAAQRQQQVIDEQIKILQRIIETGVRRGVFKKPTSPYVPYIIISGLRGILFQLLEAKNAPPLDEAIDALLGLLLEGICR